MDPISIASAAAGTAKLAWNVSEALYTFFHDVKGIDHTVAGLIGEVQALSGACSLVDERLRDIVQNFGDRCVQSGGESRTRLWACVEAQIVDCQQSVTQLHSAIAGLVKDGTNPFAQAWRQVKLNMQAKDIGEARNRIRSHTASLQTILQTVAIEICYLGPKLADQQLRTLLTRTEECMEQLRALRLERAEVKGRPQAAEDNVLKLSEEVTLDGESLYTRSQASGSLIDHRPGVEGGVNISEWMHDISAIDAIVSRSTSLAYRTNVDVPVSTSEHVASRQSTIASRARILEDDASDDEMLSEVALEALSSGKTFFAASDYREANSYLREALKIVRELPVKRQKLCDTWELRFMLSVCAYQLLEPAECEGDLIRIIDSSSELVGRTDEQLLQLCEAGHCLSQVCIRLNKLDQARLYCDNALQGRRRLLGKTHVQYYSSVALLAKVHQLQGSDTRAKIYLRTIPEPQRESYEQMFDGLVPQETTREVQVMETSAALVDTDSVADDAHSDEDERFTDTNVAHALDPEPAAPKQKKKSVYDPTRWMPILSKRSPLSVETDTKEPLPSLEQSGSSGLVHKASKEASVSSDTTSLSSRISEQSSGTKKPHRDNGSIGSASDAPLGRSISEANLAPSTRHNAQARFGLFGRRRIEASAPTLTQSRSTYGYRAMSDTPRHQRKELEYFESKAQTAGLLRMSSHVIQGIRTGAYERAQVDEMIADRAKAIRNSSLTAVLIADKHRASRSAAGRDESSAQLYTNYGQIHIALRSDFTELDEATATSVRRSWLSLLAACSSNVYLNKRFQRRHLDQWSAYGVFGASSGTNDKGIQQDLVELLPELASAHFKHERVGDIVRGGEVAMAILGKRSGLTTNMGDAMILRSSAVLRRGDASILEADSTQYHELEHPSMAEVGTGLEAVELPAEHGVVEAAGSISTKAGAAVELGT